MPHNTMNPVGSEAWEDGVDNIGVLDQLLNSDQDEVSDRLGQPKLSWEGLIRRFQAKMDSIHFLTPAMFIGAYPTPQEAIQALCDTAKSTGMPVVAWGTSLTLTANLTMDGIRWIGGEIIGGKSLLTTNAILEDVYLNTVAISHKSGDLKMRNAKMSNQTQTAQILISKLLADGVLEITDSKFSKANYGILQQGGNRNGAFITRGRISRCDFTDMNGDAIELNVVNGHYQNGAMIIDDITLDNVNNTNNQPNWGIGIGIAGAGPYAWGLAEENYASNVIVRNIRATGCRQPVHFEMSKDFMIENVWVNSDSSKSPSSGLDAAGVVAYGCKNFTINGVFGEPIQDGGRLVFVAWGVNEGTYAMPCLNFTVKNVITRTGAVLIMTAATDTVANDFTIANIEAKTVTVQGLGSKMMLTDIKTEKFTGQGNDNKPYLRNAGIEVVIDNVMSTSPAGERTGSYASLYCDRLTTSGCNFEVKQVAQFSGTRGALVGNVGNIYYLNDDVFPPGREFAAGDLLFKRTGGKFLITRSGAYVVSNDQIKATPVGQDYIESSGTRPWGTTSAKSAGTKIIIPGAGEDGADLTTVITSSARAVSGTYRVSISPAIVTAVPAGTVIRGANPIVLDDGYIAIA